MPALNPRGDTTPYDQGWDTWLAEGSASENPFCQTSDPDEWEEWNEGFNDARADDGEDDEPDEGFF